MELIIERQPLFDAMQQVATIVPTRTTVDILLNVHLQAASNALTVTGTDLDIEIAATCVAEVSRAGQATVPARLLADIVRRAEQGSDIRLTYEPAADPRMKVKSGRSNYSLPVLPAGDFPTMPAVEGGVCFEVLGSEMLRLIDKTQHAISSDETRYYLTGGYFHVIQDEDGHWLRMTATDGKRMAQADIPIPVGAEAASGLIIPRKSLTALHRLATATKGAINLALGATKFSATSGDIAITSKVIEGTFPDYQRITPRGNGRSIARIKGADLARTIDRAGIMAPDKSRSLKFSFAETALTVSARTETGGDAVVQTQTEHTGDPIEIGFNAAFVHDVTTLIGDHTLAFHLFDPGGAARIDDVDDPNCTFVVMPLRI
jgi:DNA polymerase-3 subunit beta